MTLTMMDRKLFLAPIGDSPQHVIDLGTGTGIWALDFADQYPSAEVGCYHVDYCVCANFSTRRSLVLI